MKSKTLFYLILMTFLTFFSLALHAQTFSVIHAFTGGSGGKEPRAGVTIQGNALYGTTYGGDCYGNIGNAYQLTHSGSNWLFSPLAALPHNCGPHARVAFGPDGHLYGTSLYGGTYRTGTVFKLTPQVGPCRDAACYWRVNDLYDFRGGTDGSGPSGDLLWDQQGNIYGIILGGGTSFYGTVYELTPSGNGYTESVLYTFSGPDGALPNGIVFDDKGNLFGTTVAGGSFGFGTIFELSYVPGVGWTEHVLYNFKGTDDGWNGLTGLIFDSAGNLYGTTFEGGSGEGGTVFELSPSGDTWTFKLLYSLPGRKDYPCGPVATLSMDEAGNLYGTTMCNGIYGKGNIFKLSNTANGWEYTSLHDFTGGADGVGIYSNVTIDTDGTLYGTAARGGDMNCGGGYGCGVVWMIKP